MLIAPLDSFMVPSYDQTTEKSPRVLKKRVLKFERMGLYGETRQGNKESEE